MSVRKRLAFALLTFTLFFALIEGIARIVWSRMEANVLAQVAKGGEAVLRNDAINYLKDPSPVYGYVLKPGYQHDGWIVNEAGFFQREPVERARAPGTLRVVSMGESTTQGGDVDRGNYPTHLRTLLATATEGYAGTEVINAGVSGWVSDQVALRAEHELAAFRPDVVVLYMGWNDFQSYDPFGAPPTESYFDTTYGYVDLSPFASLRSVALLTALRDHQLRQARLKDPPRAPAAGSASEPRETYRYFLRNLDRIVAAFRRENPQVVIAISTLAARWPQGTQEDFDSQYGHVWWMKEHGMGPQEASVALARFNALIREYAAERGLVLVDMEAEYAALDRSRLFFDFAHMHPDGYALMAGTIYEALRKAGAVNGKPATTRLELEQRYGLAAR